MTGRRSFLRKAALASVGVGVGVFALPAPPSSPATVHPSASADDGADAGDLPWAGEKITDEDDAPLAQYQYRKAGDEFVPTAPINVVFPLEGTSLASDADAGSAGDRTGLEAVLAVLEDAGWTRTFEEYTRYAWNRETASYVLQEASAAESYYGTSGRLHVRCWSFEDVVSMQAHEDSGARPKHKVPSYERGRTAIDALFRAAGWAVASAAVDLGNEREPDHDGYATIVRPEGAA